MRLFSYPNVTKVVDFLSICRDSEDSWLLVMGDVCQNMGNKTKVPYVKSRYGMR